MLIIILLECTHFVILSKYSHVIILQLFKLSMYIHRSILIANSPGLLY